MYMAGNVLDWLCNAVHRRRDGDDDPVDGGAEGWRSTVEKRGTHFTVQGRRFYVNGFNTYWLMVLAADPSSRPLVTEVFRQAASVGLTVCRTWAFSDGGWRALQRSPSVYDEEVFEALDFVVREARRHGIRLVLALCNNWEGFGGKARYAAWGRAAAGLSLASDDDFFSHPTLKGYYRAHASAVLSRVNTFTSIAYKDDPTIFAWELMNEPQCPSDPSGDILQSWIEEMAAHVKSVDPVHLLGIGSEGFYGPSTPDRSRFNPGDFAGRVGTDFIRNHRAPGIDFASAHVYPDTWFAKAWMESHIADAVRHLGMPILFGKYGVSSRGERSDAALRDAFVGTVCDTLLRATGREGAGGGCLLWQLFPEGVDDMDDGYAVVLGRSPGTARRLAAQSQKLRRSSARCSRKCRPELKKKKEGGPAHGDGETSS